MVSSMIAETLKNIVDLVLPPRCVLSGQIVASEGALAPEIWAKLRFIASPLCRTCGLPFDFSADAGGDGADTDCVFCTREAPPFDCLRSSLVYDDQSRDLILRFKHADRIEGVGAFAGWMERAGANLVAGADMIAPVPLHPLRLLVRRYNQSALLAQALAKRAGKSYAPELLRRHRATQSQGKRGFKDRYKNVRGAFSVPVPSQVQGKNILVIDDVYTSGATIRECSSVLKDAGAARVDVLTLMRVVKADVY